MQEFNIEKYTPPLPPAEPPALSYSVRDCVAVGFRHVPIMVLSFVSILLGVVLVTWMMPPKYEAQTKILVKGNRVDQVFSPDRNTQLVVPDMSETDINSEVELLRSRDLMERVVIENGLHNSTKLSLARTILLKFGINLDGNTSGQDPHLAWAVRALEEALKVDSVRRTKLIQVSYSSPDPKLAANVLHTLVRLYMEKHLAVHRLAGATDFFQAQTDEYRKHLNDAEQKLVQFNEKKGVVSPALEKELMVKKLNDAEAQLHQTQTSISEVQERIKRLEDQAVSTPARIKTAVKTADNPYLIQDIKKNLLNLEQEKSQLLAKFTPEYRLVQEVQARIDLANEALRNAQQNPVREETTDRDAAHEWVMTQLTMARADLTTYQARLTSTSQVVDRYREQARQIGDAEVAQQDLVRSTKTAEDSFMLYSRKQEEARISDALDNQRIVNVAIAEEASVPTLPSSPKWSINLLLGLVLATSVSLSSAVIADYLDRTVRTPDEVEVFLNVPVLASLPKN